MQLCGVVAYCASKLLEAVVAIHHLDGPAGSALSHKLQEAMQLNAQPQGHVADNKSNAAFRAAWSSYKRPYPKRRVSEH